MAVEVAEIYIHIFERGRHDVSPDSPSLPQKNTHTGIASSPALDTNR